MRACIHYITRIKLIDPWISYTAQAHLDFHAIAVVAALLRGTVLLVVFVPLDDFVAPVTVREVA